LYLRVRVLMTFWARFLLAVLATWRVTHLLAVEDGPAGMVARLRARLGRSIVGELLDCFLCLSLWVALPFALFVDRTVPQVFVVWLALSGGACLCEGIGQPGISVRTLAEDNQGVEQNGVLRSTTGGSRKP
jgi:hypothetical protein